MARYDVRISKPTATMTCDTSMCITLKSEGGPSNGTYYQFAKNSNQKVLEFF